MLRMTPSITITASFIDLRRATCLSLGDPAHRQLISYQQSGEQLQIFQHVLQVLYQLLPVLHIESCALSCRFCADRADQERKHIDSGSWSRAGARTDPSPVRGACPANQAPLNSAACLHNDYTAQGAPGRSPELSYGINELADGS